MSQACLRLAAIVLISLLLTNSAAALYTRKGPVSLLNAKTFKKAIHQSDLPAIVEFFAPWCGHCKALSPAYTKVAESLQGIATVAAVDCDDQSNAPICQEYQIQGFPTLKIFPANKPKASAKRKTKYPSDYNGPRTAKGISEAITSALPSTHVTRIKDDSSYKSFTAGSSLPKVLLFTDKPKTSALYKSLSLRFKDHFAFGEVNSKVGEIVRLHGISKFPALVLSRGDAEKAEEYTGAFKAADLIAYLKEQAGDTPIPDAGTEEEDAGASGGSKGKKQKEEEVMQIVRELNATDFESLSEDEDAWLIAFHRGDSQSCSQKLKEWNKVNFQLSGMTLAGQVNVSQAAAPDLKPWTDAGLDVKALQASPCSLQILLLPFGEKDEPVLYKGNVTVKDLQAFATASFPDIVSRISGSTIDNIFGTTMSQPKLVLFTDKEETPGMFRALAASFRKYKLHFFTIHSSDKQAMQQFGISKVPTVVLAYVPPGEALAEKTPEGASKLQLQPFPGPLKYPYLAGWLTMAAQELNILPEGLQGDRAGPGSPSAPPAAVSEVSTSEAFQEQCTDTAGICIIAALDPSSPDFEAHKSTLQAAASSSSSKALHYMWLDITRQHSFWSQLGVQQGEGPTAVAVSPKKRRQASLEAAGFTAAGLKEFAEKLINGKLGTQPLQELPRVVTGGEEPLAVESEVEEEFDLADVLGEELDEKTITQQDRLRQLAEQEEEEAKRREQGNADTQRDSAKKGKKRSSKKKKKQKTEL